MSGPVCRVLSPGVSATIQDAGRPGWRRFGIPAGGAMDAPAATWANRLVGNPGSHPVLELALQGVELLLLRDAWLAVTGAEAGSALPAWSAAELSAGTRLSFPRNQVGLWTYVAVAGGWRSERWLGSASAYPRGRLGRPLQAGDELEAGEGGFPPPVIASRFVREDERPDYAEPAPFQLLAAPQTGLFEAAARDRLIEATWVVAADSDRTGFRLEGPSLAEEVPHLASEPVLPGSLQVPGNGRPIVIMSDGPTVGGYPKIAHLPERERWRLAQCRPGTEVRFTWEEVAPRRKIVFNCDLGEGEPPERTAALMRVIGAANIACGGHAGDAGSIRRCLDLCRRHDVLPGAHPGLPGAFGRGAAAGLSPEEFRQLLEEQLGLFEQLLGEAGMALHHVKLHGSLYHAVERDPALGAVYLEAVGGRRVRPVIFSLAGGTFAARARAQGFEVWEEVFADRNYAADGTLLPRSHPEALITDPTRIRARWEMLRDRGDLMSIEGRCLHFDARTVCFHGDTPGIVEALRLIW